MKIKCSHSGLGISDDKPEPIEFPSNAIDILADDGRPLFSIHQNQNGTIDISVGMHCKHLGVFLDNAILVRPVASNVVRIQRTEYKR